LKPLNLVTDAAFAAFKRPWPNRSDQAISAVAPVRTAGYGRRIAKKTQEKGETTSRRAIRPGISQVWAIILCAALLSGCASTKTSTFEDVKPADELYADGLELLEGRRILGLFTLVNYDSAIERFQAIVDNYPTASSKSAPSSRSQTPISLTIDSKKPSPTIKISRICIRNIPVSLIRYCARHNATITRSSPSSGTRAPPSRRPRRSKS
jgi:hypothetical protein